MRAWEKVKAKAKAIKNRPLYGNLEEDVSLASVSATMVTTIPGTSEAPVLRQPSHSEKRREPLKAPDAPIVIASEMAVPSGLNTDLQSQVSDAAAQHSNVDSHQAPEVAGSVSQDSIPITGPQLSDDGVSVPTNGNSQQNKPSTEPLTPRDLWKEALNGLDEKEKEKLDSIKKLEASPEPTGDRTREHVDAILSNARKMKEEDKKQSWMPAINKLIDATVKFKSLVDAGMQFDKSGYGALAWSIVSFGLEIAKNAEGAREFVFSSSEIITQLMERYLEYENLYRVLLTDDKFENRIMNVYKALLLYTIALNNYLTQSPWIHHARALVPPDQQIISQKKMAVEAADSEVKDWIPIVGTQCDNIRFSKLQKQIADLTQPIYRVSERMKHIQGYLEMSDRQEVLGWLPDQDIQEKVHADIMNTTMIENPGKWITALEDFKQWQNSRDSCGIWLHGGLGTGKTVLTSTVVDHLSALYNGTTRGAMAYYYCSGTANAKPTMSDILRSILRQLISTDEGFDKFMNWKIGRERRDLTNESIKKLIGEMIKLNTSQTTIILDALDEADRENSLYVISFLEGLISQDWGLVKVFISSRPEEYIKLALGSWVKIEVSPEATKQDIKTYIDTQVDNFLHLRPTDKVEKKTHKAEEDKLKDDVKAFLNGRANGMFRYIEMAIPWICQPVKASKIRAAMKEIPDNLLDVYEKLFQRIKKDRRPNQELARRAISWVFGAQTQLRADDFIKAISSGYEKYAETVTVDDVISCCHHLLVYKPSSDLIEFSHFSVVQFIENEKRDEYSHTQVQSLISFLCLKAMWETARVNDQSVRSDLVEKYVECLREKGGSHVHGKDSGNSSKKPVSFWCYATNLWAFHCEGSGADFGKDSSWEEPLRQWCEIKRFVKDIPFTEHSRASFGVNSIGHRIPERLAKNFDEWFFMVSCAFGLHNTLQKLLVSSPQLAQIRFDAIAGIHLSARWGHLRSLELLQKAGVFVDFPDTALWTPLAYAIRGKHDEVTKFLLSQHANPDSQSSAGVTLLDLAKDLDFEAGVTALIKSGAKLQGDEAGESTRKMRQLYDPPHAQYSYKNVPFERVSVLDHGFFSQIFRVTLRDHPSDHLAQKKLLLPSITMQPVTEPADPSQKYFDKEFRREVDIMKALVHQHIIRVVATYEEVSSKGLIEELCFTMLPVGDRNLRAYLSEIERNVDVYDLNHQLRRLETWTSCLASAVAYMHSRRIQHGDIKPENIICKGDKVFFIDFGVSIDHSIVKWSITQYGGTWAYRAPEMDVACNKWTAELLAPFGFPADIFSLGAVFAEMSIVRSKGSLGKLFPPVPWCEMEPEKWLESTQLEVRGSELIIQMLSKNPNDRPTALQVLSNLRMANPSPACDCMPQFGPKEDVSTSLCTNL